MPRDFTVSRDNAVHHRRRRDRAIFERNKPETENHRARSNSMPNNMAPGYVDKQASTNQNDTTTAGNAHDRDLTNQSSENHHNVSPPSSVSKYSQTNDVTAKIELRKKNDESRDTTKSRDKTKSRSFSSFLRKLTQFRVTSSKRELPVKLVSYTTENAREETSWRQASRSHVSRHESLTSRDSVSVSASDSLTESKRRQGDTAVTSLMRYDSDVTVMKSRHDGLLASRDASLTSRAVSHDILTSKSSSVLKLAGQSSVTGSHQLIRHESLSSNDVVASRRHEPVRHNSQYTRMNSAGNHVTKSRRHRVKSRSHSAAASQRHNLARHKSLPTITLSTNVTSRRHDVDLTRNRLPSRRHSLHEVIVTSPSHDVQPTTMTSCGNNVTTSRRHSTRQIKTSKSNSSTDNSRVCDLDNVTSTESRQRQNSLTSRPVTSHDAGSHEKVMLKSSSVSSQSLSSSSMKHLIVSSTDQRNATVTVSPSLHSSPSTSSDSPGLVTAKTTPSDTRGLVVASISKSPLSSKRNQTRSDRHQPVPTAQRNAGRVSQSTPTLSSSISSSSSLDSQDEVTRKEESPSKPSPERHEASTFSCGHSVPTEQRHTNRPLSSSSSLSRSTSLLSPASNNQKHHRKSEWKPGMLLSTEQTTPISDSNRPVPPPRKTTARKNPASSVQPSSSLSRTHQDITSDSMSTATTTSGQTQYIHELSDTTFDLPTSTLPQQRSSHTSTLLVQSLPSTSPAFDHNSVTITPQTVDTLQTAAHSNYNLQAYQDGAQQASADDPDVLGNSSKRRSRTETGIYSPKITATEYKLLSHRQDGHETPDSCGDLLESRSRLETANVVVVRPLPTSDYEINDSVTKSRSRQETVCLTPISVMTGSDDEDDMRSRHSSVSGVSLASGMKSALRKTSRSQSCDRHVSYSNTDTVYRSAVLFH